MLIRYGYEIRLSCPQPTPLICLLSVEEARRGDLLGPEEFRTTPDLAAHQYEDMFGNRCTRLLAPAGELTLYGNALIRDSGQPDPVFPEARALPVQDLPDAHLVYLMGSRYCETDRLSDLAWQMFGHLPSGWAQVQAISDYVHNHIRFDYQQASATRTAYDVWQGQVGVCRDYTHLAVTLCRCLNIPTRYVNGHLGDIGVPPVPDPMDFCAWMEVWLDGAWHTFDPRNNQRRIGRVVLARGRDAADVPLINSFGPHSLLSFQVWTDEVPEE